MDCFVTRFRGLLAMTNQDTTQLSDRMVDGGTFVPAPGVIRVELRLGATKSPAVKGGAG
jgi:hypothetical protein